MKIKKILPASIITVLFVLSACGGSGSDSKSGGKKKGGKKEVITGEEEVKKALNQAQEVVAKGAVISLICECGSSFVRGQGETETTAKEQAQDKCKLSERSASISNCEQPGAT